MDRTAYAACAGTLFSLGAALVAACDAVEAHQAPAAGATADSAERVQLPWAGTRTRTPDVVVALRQADSRVRTGFDRAARGAHYSARAEFVAALRAIARGSDIQQDTTHHTRALGRGLTALRESRDFAHRGTDQPDADVRRILSGHQTPILQEEDAKNLTPAAAAERYCGYAKEQLAAATAGEATGSMALFGLAKVAIVAGRSEPQPPPWQTMQATALYQAALLANGNNFCAAHELGVLLAETGHLEQARDLLIRSVSISPQAVTWHSLASVHARLGESKLAEQAQAEADALPRPRTSGSRPDVQWVDANRFAGTASASDWQPPARPLAQQMPTTVSPSAAKPPVNVAKRPFTDWIPWKSRR